MRLKFLFPVLGGILACSYAQASKVYPLNEKEKIKASISLKELNRIRVEGDRISQVFGGEGLLEIETEEQQGQIYVRPSLRVGQEPLSLSLVLESGATQDMMLLPQDIPSETILIQAPNGSNETKKNLKKTTQKLIDKILQFIKEIGKREHLNIYEHKEVPMSFSLKPDIQVTKYAHYQSEELIAEEWLIENKSQKEMSLTEKDLTKTKDIKAFSLEKRTIPAGGRTHALVIRRI